MYLLCLTAFCDVKYYYYYFYYIKYFIILKCYLSKYYIKQFWNKMAQNIFFYISYYMYSTYN